MSAAAVSERAEDERRIQRAVDLIMSVGERGIRPPAAETALRVIDGYAPGFLDAVLDQCSRFAILQRKWVQLIRGAISAYDEYEFRARVPERIRDWQRSIHAFPAALELAEAIEFRRRIIAVGHVGTWVSRVARESGSEPTPEEIRALVVIAVLGNHHEGASGANSVYTIVRGREESLTAMHRARTLAPHADAALRIVPEMMRRGAGFDEGLIHSLLTVAEPGPALLDGQL